MFSHSFDINIDMQLYKLPIANMYLFEDLFTMDTTYEIYIDIRWGIKSIITQDNVKKPF